MIDFGKIADLELCKKLRIEGYSKPTEYYWQEKDLPYVKSGLKRMKDGKKINHNKYEDFFFSAPTKQEAIDWLIGKKIKYDSSVVLHLGPGNINWDKEKAISGKNYCGYCTGSPPDASCNSSCFKESYTPDFQKNREDHVNSNIKNLSRKLRAYREEKKLLKSKNDSNE